MARPRRDAPRCPTVHLVLDVVGRDALSDTGIECAAVLTGEVDHHPRGDGLGMRGPSDRDARSITSATVRPRSPEAGPDSAGANPVTTLPGASEHQDRCERGA